MILKFKNWLFGLKWRAKLNIFYQKNLYLQQNYHHFLHDIPIPWLYYYHVHRKKNKSAICTTIFWLKLDEKNNLIKNLERARGEGGLKIYDSTLKFFWLCCYFRVGGWVKTLTVKNCYFLRVYILARLLRKNPLITQFTSHITAKVESIVHIFESF